MRFQKLREHRMNLFEFAFHLEMENKIVIGVKCVQFSSLASDKEE